VPSANSQPWTIAAGPDGRLWMTELNTSKIARITTAGAYVEFPVTNGSLPVGITSGPDGNIWFTEFHAIGKMTTSGKLPLEKRTPHAPVEGMPVESDRNFWFAEDGGASHIAAITTAGTFLPEVSTLAGFANYIAPGPDGALWFTEVGGNGKIGRV